MASAAIAAPGTKFGPCEGECQHRDCAASRRMVEVPCSICFEKIGYDTNFYRAEDDGDWTRLVHAGCYEHQVESQAGAK